MRSDKDLKPIEELIFKAQKTGYINAYDFYEGIQQSQNQMKDIAQSLIRDEMKNLLITYKLIKNKKDNNTYPLTLRGMRFESFAKEDERARKKEAVNKLNEDLLKSNVWTNRITWLNVAMTLLFTGVIVWLQVKTNKREAIREQREVRKELKEEQNELQQLRRDSLYANYLLRKAQEVATFPKNDSVIK